MQTLAPMECSPTRFRKFGLYHCIYYRCLMNGSNHEQETDRQPVHPCPICLQKLQRAIRFDLIKRYDELGRFYATHGLDQERGWIAERMKELQAR